MRILFVSVAMLIATIGYTQSLPDLVVDGRTEYLYGDHQYQIVHIINGGRITISQPNGFPATGFLGLYCQSLIVDASSRIDGRGWGSAGAPGGYPPDPNRGGNGGFYGGRGGAERSAIQESAFGTLRGLDIFYGASGTWGAAIQTGNGITVLGGVGGHGGAGITIQADSVDIQGMIDVNGDPGERAPRCPARDSCDHGPTAGGGGAGGGVLILANELTIGPKARITANGDNGGDALSALSGGFGGGGGRIKVFYEVGIISTTSSITALPGKSIRELWASEPCECPPPEPGTIWIQQVPSISQLLNPSADFNKDGTVDVKDAMALSEQWMDADPTVTPWMTRTPFPTWTPRNTRTPLPSYTPTPTRSPTPEVTMTPTLSTDLKPAKAY